MNPVRDTLFLHPAVVVWVIMPARRDLSCCWTERTQMQRAASAKSLFNSKRLCSRCESLAAEHKTMKTNKKARSRTDPCMQTGKLNFILQLGCSLKHRDCSSGETYLIFGADPAAWKNPNYSSCGRHRGGKTQSTWIAPDLKHDSWKTDCDRALDNGSDWLI